MALVAVCSLAGQAVSQDENELSLSEWYAVAPEFRDKLEIHLGSVDVTVIDRKTGRAVPGLEPGAFRLFVDGEPRELSNFAAYGIGEPAIALPDSVGAPAVGDPTERPVRPHLFVIFIDNENISRPNRNIVLDRLDRFVREYIHPPHRALVVVNNPGLRRVGRLTSDADEIMANLESLVGTTTGATKVHTFSRFAESRIRELAQLGPANQVLEITIQQALAVARMNAEQTDEAVRQAIESLKTLIRTIGGAPGRKDVIYVSDGIPRSPGREHFLLVDELFRVREGIQQTQGRDRMDRFLQVVAYAMAAGVTVHTIDAAGLQVDHGSRADTAWYRTADFEVMRRENYQAPLFFMADRTGGIAVINTNEIEQGLVEVGDAARTYYSLGFPLESPLRDRSHRIDISTPDHPEYRLLYHQVFRERTPATIAAERTMTGLLIDLEDNPLGIEAEVGEARAVGEKGLVIPVLIHAPLSSLTLLPVGEEMTGRVSTFSVAGSEAGAKSKVQHSSQVLQVPADRYQQITTVTFQIEVETEVGTERISMGILDETSGAASYTTVDVNASDGPAE